MKKPILLFIALLFLVVSADANYYGVIARKNVYVETPPDWVVSNSASGSGTTCTVALTTVAGSNRGFVFFALWEEGARAPSTMTFDDNAMTSITATTRGTREIQMWYYANSAYSGTGSKNFVLTLDGSVAKMCWAAQIDGVDQADFLDASAAFSVDGTDPNTITLTLDPVDTNTLMVSGAGIGDVDDFLTAANGQTRDANTVIGLTGSSIAGGYEDNVSGASDTHVWTSASTYLNELGIIISINPSN